jgi:hypothetical protein
MGDLVIRYFKLGIYKTADLSLFVSAGYITQAQADSLIESEVK